MVALSPDAAAIEQELGQWTTLVDLHGTMRRRDKKWTPPRVDAALEELIQKRGIELTGEPPRYRSRRVTPGEVDPRRGPGLDA